MGRFCLSVLVVCLSVLAVGADDSALLQRIVALEKRVKALEAQLEPVLEEERVKQLVALHQQKARDRMMRDAEYYSRGVLREIEARYSAAKADWKSEACIAGLKALVEAYPNANRSGCAVLNLGQMTEGAEQERYLMLAIERFHGCYFSDGVQVGPYARLYLGMRYLRDGQEKKAAALFESIRNEYPDAVGHDGKLLLSQLEGL
jgi:hypothetical protein